MLFRSVLGRIDHAGPEQGGAVHAIKNSAEREIGEYKAKYGDAWSERYLQDCCGDDDYSADMHTVNSAILYGTSLIGTRFFDMQETRMRELYGSQYDELRQHLARDERVIELLLADAVKTGRWRELPEELLSDYYRSGRNAPCFSYGDIRPDLL